MITPPSQSDRLNSALAGRYRVERELGSGGMATVYLAEDLRHDRKVAIKVLKPELAAVLGAERFVVEIKTTASLSHPHILPLFDSGTADGFLFYVMPYIEGETIRDTLNRESQFAVDDAVRIAREVADALDYAHRHGVIHRDIKPENLLLHDGRAMVMDFGIALAVSAAAGGRMTETGLSLGTPHYMSPEQATAEKDLTGRSDIYSLGTVLFEMLAGQPPHIGGSAQQIIMKIITEDARPLIELRKSVPQNVSAAVTRALQKIPADRFASAKEFSDALANTSFGTNAYESSRVPTRRNRVDWRMAAVGGFLVGAISVWLATAIMAPRASVTSPGVDVRGQLTFNGRSLHPAISPDGKWVAYSERSCPQGPLYQCSWSLITMERGSNRPITVIDSALTIEMPRFSNDGLLLIVDAALDSSRQGLYVLPRLGGVPRRIGDFQSFDQRASGDTIVIAPYHQVGRFARFVLPANGAVLDSVPLPAVRVDGIAASADGRFFAVVTAYNQLTIFGRDGKTLDTLTGTFRDVIRWMPDGSGVVVFRALEGNEDDLDYYPVDREGKFGKREVLLPKVPTLLFGEFDIARTARTVLLSTGAAVSDLWTFDFAGNVRQRTSGTTWYGDPTISPDGNTIYYQRGDATGDNLYRLAAPDHEEALTADSVPSYFRETALSRDGSRIVFGQSTRSGVRYGLLDVVTRQVRFELTREAPMAPVPITGGIIHLLSDGRGLRIVDSTSKAGREWRLPDSLQLISFDIAPGEATVALLLGTGRETWLATSPLARFQPTVLTRFARNDLPDAPNWSDDGWISFSMKRGNDVPALWGIRASGGALVERAQLPAACRRRWVRIARSAPLGVCTSFDQRPDIWTIDLPRLHR